MNHSHDTTKHNASYPSEVGEGSTALEGSTPPGPSVSSSPNSTSSIGSSSDPPTNIPFVVLGALWSVAAFFLRIFANGLAGFLGFISFLQAWYAVYKRRKRQIDRGSWDTSSDDEATAGEEDECYDDLSSGGSASDFTDDNNSDGDYTGAGGGGGDDDFSNEHNNHHRARLHHNRRRSVTSLAFTNGFSPTTASASSSSPLFNASAQTTLTNAEWGGMLMMGGDGNKEAKRRRRRGGDGGVDRLSHRLVSFIYSAPQRIHDFAADPMSALIGGPFGSNSSSSSPRTSRYSSPNTHQQQQHSQNSNSESHDSTYSPPISPNSAAAMAAEFPLSKRLAKETSAFTAAYKRRQAINQRIREEGEGCVEERRLKVTVASWNVAQQAPPEAFDELSEWLLGVDLASHKAAKLKREKEEDEKKMAETAASSAASPLPPFDLPDLVVIGLQEVELGGAALVFETTESKVAWTEAVIECLNSASALHYQDFLARNNRPQPTTGHRRRNGVVSPSAATSPVIGTSAGTLPFPKVVADHNNSNNTTVPTSNSGDGGALSPQDSQHSSAAGVGGCSSSSAGGGDSEESPAASHTAGKRARGHFGNVRFGGSAHSGGGSRRMDDYSSKGGYNSKSASSLSSVMISPCPPTTAAAGTDDGSPTVTGGDPSPPPSPPRAGAEAEDCNMGTSTTAASPHLSYPPHMVTHYRYRKVESLQLVGIVLIVIARHDHFHNISHCHTSLSRTGVRGMMGNKGAIGARFSLYGKRFLFLGAHFDASVKSKERRNANYRDAMTAMHFPLLPAQDDELDRLMQFAYGLPHHHNPSAATTAASGSAHDGSGSASLYDQHGISTSGGNNVAGGAVDGSIGSTAFGLGGSADGAIFGSAVAGRSAFYRFFKGKGDLNKDTKTTAAQEHRTLSSHDYVFFFGDLNYRLNIAKGGGGPSSSSGGGGVKKGGRRSSSSSHRGGSSSRRSSSASALHDVPLLSSPLKFVSWIGGMLKLGGGGASGQQQHRDEGGSTTASPSESRSQAHSRTNSNEDLQQQLMYSDQMLSPMHSEFNLKSVDGNNPNKKSTSINNKLGKVIASVSGLLLGGSAKKATRGSAPNQHSSSSPAVLLSNNDASQPSSNHRSSLRRRLIASAANMGNGGDESNNTSFASSVNDNASSFADSSSPKHVSIATLAANNTDADAEHPSHHHHNHNKQVRSSSNNGLSTSLLMPIIDIRRYIAAGRLSDLLATDQLTREMARGRIFRGFHEQPITFPPTYKFDKGTKTYDTSWKRRDPAWTDRVLYWFAPEGIVCGSDACREAYPSQQYQQQQMSALNHQNGDGNCSVSSVQNNTDPSANNAINIPSSTTKKPSALDVHKRFQFTRNSVEEDGYTAAGEMLQSDHRAIAAKFTVTAGRAKEDKMRQLLFDLRQDLGLLDEEWDEGAFAL